MTLTDSRILVVGAGLMGAGIAQVAAQAGHAVRLYDTRAGAAEAAKAKLAQTLDSLVAKGKLTAEAVQATLARITPADAPGGDVDLVIEAIVENLEVKRALFAELEALLPADAVIATNTSSISVTALARGMKAPGRLVGMHFFNPVHVMKLVEVVAHATASREAVALAVAYAERLGKTPITVTDSPGFASSRLGLVIGLEAMRMVEQGVASAADIDTAMKLGYGHPMGPLELTDLVGLDVRLGIAEYLTRQIGDTFQPPQLLREKVAAGKLGKKSGEGYYRWSPDGKRLG